MTATRRSRGKQATSPVVLRGTPSALTVLLEPPTAAATTSGEEVAADFPGAEVERFRVVRRRGEPPAVRLRLAASTAPGTYEGKITVGGTSVPAVAEVVAKPRLRASPGRLLLSASAGAGHKETLTITNVGNVACTLPDRSRVGLLADGAWGGAFWYALTEPNGEGLRRFERFIDRLADQAAGLAEVQVRKGITIEPGASELVEITVRLPDVLEAGCKYHGTWEPQGLRLRLRVTGEQAAPARRRRSRS